jgi:murein DD-endopeptidase MepM/ murein hydrolase activator NlpD
MVRAFRLSAATLAMGSVAFVSGGPGETPGEYLNWGPYPPIAPFTTKALPSQRVVCPMIFPVVGWSHFKNSYGVKMIDHRHTAIDIGAAKMTPIVAPFSGTIGFKRETFWIYGDNGWAVLGTHLNDDNIGRDDESGGRDVMFAPDLVPGQHVKAGRFIGYVGASGKVTGPHLHFELFAPGKHLRNPFASLKYSQRLKAPRVTLANPKAKPKKGQVRYAGCIRKLEPEKKRVTLVLTAVQESTGATRAVSKVKYLKFGASDPAVQMAGGWDSLSELPPEAVVSAYVAAKPGPEGMVARQLTVDTPVTN